MHLSDLCSLCCLLLVSAVVRVSAQTDIYVLHICHSLIRGDAYTAHNVDFMLDIANNRSDILPGYNIKAIHGYMGQSPNRIGSAVLELMKAIYTPPVKLMMIGPTFSGEARVLAEVAPFYSLAEIGYLVSAPELSNKVQYPFFSRTSETTVVHNPVILKVLKRFGWKRVAIVEMQSQYVSGVVADMRSILGDNNISILAAPSYKEDPTLSLKEIKDTGARIILAFYLSSAHAKTRMMCRAYKEGLFGVKYQWIHFTSWFNLLKEPYSTAARDGCTTEQVKQAMEGIIYFLPKPRKLTEDNLLMVGSTGYTRKELGIMYRKREKEKFNLTKSSYIDTVMDATWASVLGLNESISRRPEAIHTFNYNDSSWATLITDEIRKLHFLGTSGFVSFDNKGDRISDVLVFQLKGGKEVNVGVYVPINDTLVWRTPLFFQGGPPADSVVTRMISVNLDKKLFYCMSALAVAGVIFSIVCVIFNICHRETRLVKLSSPRINTMLVLGCFLSYVAILFIGMDGNLVGRANWVCPVRVWTLVLGFTLAFGSMFVKTWRVHVLFTNKTLPRKVVKDIHLFILLFGFLLIDLAIILTWQFLDPLSWKLQLLRKEENPLDPWTILQKYVYQCNCSYKNYWMGTLYAFKALLLTFGIFFSFETRKVRIEALNDSKQIGMCVYNVVTMSVITVPLINLLSKSQVDIAYAFVALSILICATTTLVLVIGSKMYMVAVHGNKVDDIAVLPFATSLRNETFTSVSNAKPQTSRSERSTGPPEAVQDKY